jgi:MFS family permease
MTIGQVTGPLAGAIAAARLGFRSSFVVGAGFLCSCPLLVGRGGPAGSPRPAGTGTAAPVRLADVISVVAIVLVGSVHMFFMPAILPQTLPTLGVESTRTLEVGGLLMFASGVGVALGSIVAPRLPELIPERRLIPGLLVAASVFVVGLAVAPTPFVYGGLRFLQVLCVAPVFPLTIARIAQGAGGQTMSVINSARIGAGFVGPVIATTVVAWTAPWVLYALLAAIGVACVPLARQRPPDVHGRQA